MVSREYSSLSAEEAQKIGRQLYRSKNYQDALKAFTAAVTRSDGAAIGALDNRAATYMKVGDLQAALRDAKHMIDLEKVGVTGYLRTGQILQLMNKADLAHEIYKYGLRNIPSDSPDHRLLQGMSEKLAQNRAPAKAVDFMLMLPVEIAEMIVKYLPTNNLV
ncbi:hypothetical protein MMC16_001477 [Acarospora aff. strigata]|nr:hypothetical protein [Acarospora aff. strigata]